MRLINIVVILLVTSLFVDAKWHDIRVLKYTKNPKSFILKSGIEYVEIYLHSIYKYYPDKKSKKSYYNSVFLKMGQKSLKSFGKSAVSSFRNYKNIAKKDKALVAYDNSNDKKYYFTYFNAYMIDSKGKFWLLESKQDLIDIIKPIDTPQEAVLIMWLNGYSSLTNANTHYRLKYKKNKNGYSILETQQRADNEYSGCVEYKYISTINKQGAITKRFLAGKKSQLCKD